MFTNRKAHKAIGDYKATKLKMKRAEEKKREHSRETYESLRGYAMAEAMGGKNRGL